MQPTLEATLVPLRDTHIQVLKAARNNLLDWLNS